jgi:hypothetical protein
MACKDGNNCIVRYTGTTLDGDAVADYRVTGKNVIITTTFQGIRFESLNMLNVSQAFAKFPGENNNAKCRDSTVSGTWFAGKNVKTPFLFGN